MYRLSMFLIGIMVFSLGLKGCGTSSNPIKCSKPATQIANMSDNYKHCKGLDYELQAK